MRVETRAPPRRTTATHTLTSTPGAMRPSINLLIWVGAFFVVNAIGAVYFAIGRDAAAKALRYRWYLVFDGLFLLAVISMLVPPKSLVPVMMIPLVVVIIVYYLRTTTFCPRCARMVRRGLRGTVTTCPHCRAPL
jgi:hypothetical protein